MKIEHHRLEIQQIDFGERVARKFERKGAMISTAPPFVHSLT